MDKRTEKEKMLAGDFYRTDSALFAEQMKSRAAMDRYNATPAQEGELRCARLAELMGTSNGATVRAPVYVDYGWNVHLGEGVFLNFNCVLLDVAEIRIGAKTQIGPNVQILTADHPRDPQQRRQDLEFGRPITIGANVWIGGGAIILPGITVGDDAIIGAGAVVTRDVPKGATVAGNPARVLRKA